jgi:hypothetical protein
MPPRTLITGADKQDEPLPVSAKVWAALNRRILYILIVNGYFGRGMEWLCLLRSDLFDMLTRHKDFVVCDKHPSML